MFSRFLFLSRDNFLSILTQLTLGGFEAARKARNEARLAHGLPPAEDHSLNYDERPRAKVRDGTWRMRILC